MDNKPNMYRVTYLVDEGNNYAGGTVEHQKDVTELAHVGSLNRVTSVTEIFIEIGEKVSDERIKKAILKAERIKEKARAEDNIKNLKAKLLNEELRLRGLK